MSTHTEITVGAERLLEGARERRRQPLLAREQVADGLFAALFLVAGVLLSLLATPERALDPWLALALVIAYALVARAEFPVGAGLVVPTQIVFVPMLLLL